jgi:hypothetical protein
MKYLKGFDSLFEAWDRSISYSPDEVKQMPEYIDLLDSCNLRDSTSPTIAKNGNVRFSENDSDMTYTIHKDGTIRSQEIGNGYNVRPQILVAPKEKDKLNSLLYGSRVESIDDYIPKFEYLKRYIFKKRDNPMPPLDSEYVSKKIDDLIANDPQWSKYPAIQKLIKRGVYIPNDYSKTVLDASHYGLI